ncbi:MAG TPA: HlyD family efflux transporter periplasmic adaptor subunit [Bacteroidota bacterium]|nr:HlyD family efflux transporter periplasmic adaptor subunit [Bacteroidota bacterium]
MDRKLEKQLWTPRRIVYTASGSFLLLLVIYSFVITDRGSRLNVEADKVTISTVSRAPFREYTPVNGTIMPIETFFLDAIEGGRVEKRYVEAGSFVKKGDPIVKLANTNLQESVMYNEALTYQQINDAQNRRLTIEQNTIAVKMQLADAGYNADRTRLNFQRDSALAEKHLISSQDFLQTKFEYESWVRKLVLAKDNFRQDSLMRIAQLSQLEGSINRLQANLEMTKHNLDNLIIRAPISGELTSLNAEIGESKSQGQRLGQIDVLNNFKVRAAIDEFYIARVNAGQGGDFELSGITYRLKITKVYPEVKDARFEVDMVFDGAIPQGIRRGQTLQVRLELGDLSEALLIPRGGFYQKTGGQWVYVVDKSGSFAVKRTVKLGRQNPQVFEVLEGLQPGEQVVTSSYDNFGDIDKLILKK